MDDVLGGLGWSSSSGSSAGGNRWAVLDFFLSPFTAMERSQLLVVRVTNNQTAADLPLERTLVFQFSISKLLRGLRAGPAGGAAPTTSLEVSRLQQLSAEQQASWFEVRHTVARNLEEFSMFASSSSSGSWLSFLPWPLSNLLSPGATPTQTNHGATSLPFYEETSAAPDDNDLPWWRRIYVPKILFFVLLVFGVSYWKAQRQEKGAAGSFGGGAAQGAFGAIGGMFGGGSNPEEESPMPIPPELLRRMGGGGGGGGRRGVDLVDRVARNTQQQIAQTRESLLQELRRERREEQEETEHDLRRELADSSEDDVPDEQGDFDDDHHELSGASVASDGASLRHRAGVGSSAAGVGTDPASSRVLGGDGVESPERLDSDANAVMRRLLAEEDD